MVFKNRSRSEVKYIINIFARMGLVTAAWFGLSSLVLHSVSDRVSLNCERGEESIPECQLRIERLFDKSKIQLISGEIQQVSRQGIYNQYFPSFVQWQMEIATTEGRLYFDRYSIAQSDDWEEFCDRTNKFLYAPELRTFTITSEYNFWFKLISQSVSGISILCGLFIIPGLYLTVKYGSDTLAQQQEIDRAIRKLNGSKSPSVIR